MLLATTLIFLKIAHCHFLQTRENVNELFWSCRFPSVFWQQKALQRVFFTQEEYTAMLRLYNKKQEEESQVDKIACDWMKDNPQVWSQWKPSDLNVKMELYIGGIFPISGPSYKSGPGMVPGT